MTCNQTRSSAPCSRKVARSRKMSALDRTLDRIDAYESSSLGDGFGYLDRDTPALPVKDACVQAPKSRSLTPKKSSSGSTGRRGAPSLSGFLERNHSDSGRERSVGSARSVSRPRGCRSVDAISIQSEHPRASAISSAAGTSSKSVSDADYQPSLSRASRFARTPPRVRDLSRSKARSEDPLFWSTHPARSKSDDHAIRSNAAGEVGTTRPSRIPTVSDPNRTYYPEGRLTNGRSLSDSAHGTYLGRNPEETESVSRRERLSKAGSASSRTRRRSKSVEPPPIGTVSATLQARPHSRPRNMRYGEMPRRGTRPGRPRDVFGAEDCQSVHSLSTYSDDLEEIVISVPQRARRPSQEHVMPISRHSADNKPKTLKTRKDGIPAASASSRRNTWRPLPCTTKPASVVYDDDESDDLSVASFADESFADATGGPHSPSRISDSPSKQTETVRRHTVHQAGSGSLIEVSPGVFERLRGADETWSSIRREFFTPVSCSACSAELCCIADASYVLCPSCRVVSHNVGGKKFSNGGVGMGFTLKDLAKWQKEITSARQ